MTQHYTDRIKSLRRVAIGDLRRHAKNWRRHPPSQHRAMRAALEEIGIIQTVLARELPDGKLELLDGHLRLDVLPSDQKVPVLVLDESVDDAMARKILVSLDSITGMAETDGELLSQLLSEIEAETDGFGELLESIGEANALDLSDNDATETDEELDESDDDDEPAEAQATADEYNVVIQCRDEQQQRELYDELKGRGLACRLLTV